MRFFVDTMVIIGVGLIGGSLAAAVAANRLARRIVGIDADSRNLRLAEKLGVIDAGAADIQEGVQGAGLIVIATPVRSIVPLLEQVGSCAPAGAIITDTGSVKGPIVAGANALPLSSLRFVPGHPIAGTERSGVEAADACLFQKRKTILTPGPRTDPAALETVTALWESVGASVLCMDCDRHDRIFGAVSHLPHMIAFSLMSYLADIEDDGAEPLQFAAGGLMDFTRIAASDPAMWTDIALLNAAAILNVIEGYQQTLGSLKDLIRCGDAEAITVAFARARAVRTSL